MSPRAAWRLERLGFTQVYDFVPGKMAWLAMGWPREGTAAAVPNAGEIARRGTPICALDDRVGDVRDEVLAVGRHVCIVVNSAGIVEGRLRLEIPATTSGSGFSLLRLHPRVDPVLEHVDLVVRPLTVTRHVPVRQT